VIVVTCNWDCNKGIINPNDVFSGVTRYNWWSELVKYHETLYNIYNIYRASVSSGQHSIVASATTV
jgi:hypothetical protein